MTEEKSFVGPEKRHELWEKMGCPAMPERMTLREYNAMFRSRHSFVNTFVLGQATSMLRILLCPACMEEDPSTGHIHTSALYVTIEDDVMTTWPAMGHFTCHNCGFEEWHPMKTDPRATASSTLHPWHLGQGIGGGGGGAAGLQQGLGNAMAQQQQSARIQQLQNAYNNAKQRQLGLSNNLGAMFGLPPYI